MSTTLSGKLHGLARISLSVCSIAAFFLASGVRADTPVCHTSAGDVCHDGKVGVPKKDAVVLGEYVEARTCDVWTGPCFSNAELNTTGEFAVLGWSVAKGSWLGQDLAGLKLTAAVRAEGTLMSRGEGAVKTIVFVDRRATDEQARALIALGKKLAGKYFTNVLDVRRADISYTRDDVEVTLEVKDTLKVKTTALSRLGDAHCGNEEVAYPSLASTDAFRCAKTIVHYYRGKGLNARWSDPFKRSAMVGTFSL